MGPGRCSGLAPDHYLRLPAEGPCECDLFLARTTESLHEQHEARKGATDVTDRTALQKQATALARGADPDALTKVFTGGGAIGHSDELRAMIVHELILAGYDVVNHPVVGRWASQCHWRHHGLGWLPVELADFEHPDPGSAAFHKEWERLLAGPSTPAAARNLEVVETTPEDCVIRAGLPFAHWVEHSNGKIDAHEYLAEQAIGDDDLREVIVRARPAFLADGDLGAVRAIPATLGQIWSLLYQAGSSASYYGPHQGGGYGRLCAWQSIAALAGAPATATPDDVAVRARSFNNTLLIWAQHVIWARHAAPPTRRTRAGPLPDVRRRRSLSSAGRRRRPARPCRAVHRSAGGVPPDVQLFRRRLITGDHLAQQPPVSLLLRGDRRIHSHLGIRDGPHGFMPESRM